MQIRQLLDGVKNFEMVIPEFQREYVWSLENAKQLMVSLFKGYPTGSLLFWETKNPPEIKNDAVQTERVGLTKVILDGQQRLTTLYLLINGEIPPYYKEKDIINDPRHLFFNLQTGEFLYYMKSKMEGNPFWLSIVDCFNQDIKIYKFIKDVEVESQEEKEKIAEQVEENLTRLKDIWKIDYPVQTVPTSAEIDEAIDVFDRVNSRGTKLTDAELVLTHVTGKWPQARRIMKNKIDELKKQNFEFDLDFFTRCLVVSLTNSALYKSVNYANYTKEDYITAWEKISKVFDYIIPILKQSALISGTNDMSTVNVLVPIVAYLLKNNGRFSEGAKSNFLYWMFLALIWGRYSGQTDQRLDKDVYIAINSQNPVVDLVNEIEDQRGRIEVKPADLEGRGSGHPIYKMLYIITKHKKAIDWANGGSIYDTIGDYYSIQSHHIFPQAVLYKNGFDSENHLDKKKVNEIANRAFITRDTNFAILDTPPSEYLPEIEKKYPGALERQFIPMEPALWGIEKYDEFLAERRELIADETNKFLQELKEETKEKVKEVDWKEIIAKGENNFVEFKSSLRWDYKENQVNKNLEYVIAKTISGFLNSEGGTLIIGADDDGVILGLDKDYSTLGKKQNRDGFLLTLVQVVNNYLGKEFNQYISVKIENVDGKDVCIVEISDSGSPVFINYHGSDQFFIRASASTQPMSMKEANEYINLHWNNGK